MKYTLPLGILLALSSCVQSPADPIVAPSRPAAPIAPAPATSGPQTPSAAAATPQANVLVNTPQARPVSPQGVSQAVPAATLAQRVAPTVPAGTSASPDAAAMASQLDIAPDERQYFQFGYYLARSAFAYAELSKRSLAISQVRSKISQIHQLADLQPSSDRKREEIRAALEKTLATMRDLRAPASAIAVIENQSREYNKPLILTGDAKLLADYNPDAGQALGALSEFEHTSGVPENAALHQWLTAPETSATAKVWYAEGLIAGIAQIASQQQMPELLPPISDVAVDLRGLRDWLSTRLPDEPAVGLTQLKDSLDSFLRLTANNRPLKRPLTPSELLMLGNVSELLTVQILGPDAIGTLTARTTLTANMAGVTGVTPPTTAVTTPVAVVQPNVTAPTTVTAVPAPTTVASPNAVATAGVPKTPAQPAPATTPNSAQPAPSRAAAAD